MTTDKRGPRRVELTACNPAHEDYTPSDGDDIAGPICAATGEPVEFSTSHDYRTDYRWRYTSGAVCQHRVIR